MPDFQEPSVPGPHRADRAVTANEKLASHEYAVVTYRLVPRAIPNMSPAAVLATVHYGPGERCLAEIELFGANGLIAKYEVHSGVVFG